MNVERLSAGIGASQSEQLFNESCRAFGFEENVPQRLAVFGLIAGATQGHFCFGMNQCDWCAEFVRSVGRKLGDAEESGFDPRQHFVQGVGEALQFIAGMQLLETAAEVVAGNGASGAGKCINRGQGFAAEPIADARRSQQQNGREHEQVSAEILKRLHFFFERAADLDDEDPAIDSHLLAQDSEGKSPEPTILVARFRQLIQGNRRKRVLFKELGAIN